MVADAGIADDWADQVTCPWASDIHGADAASVVVLPTPAATVHCPKGAHSGPHDLHENGSGTFVSERLVSATDKDVDVYVTDRDAGRCVLQYEGA